MCILANNDFFILVEGVDAGGNTKLADVETWFKKQIEVPVLAHTVKNLIYQSKSKIVLLFERHINDFVYFPK